MKKSGTCRRTGRWFSRGCFADSDRWKLFRKLRGMTGADLLRFDAAGCDKVSVTQYVCREIFE
jgi:hypothetical protein